MVTKIDPISTPPTPADPTDIFEQKASRVWADLFEAVPQMNAQAQEIEAIGQAAVAAGQSAQADSDAALGYRNEARAARDAAAGHAGSAAGAAAAADTAHAAADLAAGSAGNAAGRAEAAAEAAEGVLANAVMRTSATGAAILPEGTTGQRPSYPSGIPAVGLLMRGNTTIGRPEFFNRLTASWEKIGTAASRDVTEVQIDQNAGRVLKVNDFGLGFNGVSIGTYDWSNPGGFNGFQWEPYGATGSPSQDPSNSSYAINLCYPGGNYGLQIGAAINSESPRVRHKNNGVFGPWRTFWHDGNFNAAAVFGPGQTQKNVTSSRSPGVVYTNTSTRPILVQVVGQTGSSGTQIELLLNGTWEIFALQGTATGQTSTTLVPAGISYRLPATPVRVMEFS